MAYENEDQQVEALKKWWQENWKALVAGLGLGVGAIVVLHEAEAAGRLLVPVQPHDDPLHLARTAKELIELLLRCEEAQVANVERGRLLDRALPLVLAGALAVRVQRLDAHVAVKVRHRRRRRGRAHLSCAAHDDRDDGESTGSNRNGHFLRSL